MTNPMRLMELTSGVYAFKALALADQLGLFTDLAGGKSTSVAEFAERHGVAVRPAELLLTACTSLGLLELEGGRYLNSALAEEFLVEGKPYYFGGWVKAVDRHEYSAYLALETSLRGNHPTTWDVDKQLSLFTPDDPVMMSTFWGGMYSLSSYSATRLAKVFDFGPVLRLLDVGGGGAAYDIELCKAHPHLRTTVFDLPFVGELTRERVLAAGLGDRIDFVGGDFFADPLPGGHDALLLSNILHDWDETDVQRILANCLAALVPGGQLLICESFVDNDKTGPPLAALMSLNMLVETWGRNYTAVEYAGWLREAGFTVAGVRRFDAPGANGVLIARKP